MAENGYKKYLPSFITILFELLHQWKRDSVQNSNIKKINKTNEQLGTIEHMLVRLEKKIQHNRDLVDKLKFQLLLSWAINLLFLVVILLKVFCII